MMDWVKNIETTLLELEETPQFGAIQPFPWSTLTEHLRALCEDESLTLSHKELGWMPIGKCCDGIEDDHLTLEIFFSPLEAPLYWLMGKQDLKGAMVALLDGEERSAPFLDPGLSEGFAHFIALQVLTEIDRVQFSPGLAPRLGKIVDACPAKNAFAIDASLTVGAQTVSGRLLIPDTFRAAWKSHYVNYETPALSSEELKKVPVEVAFQMGQAGLTLAEWQKVKKGDFVVLERCSYDPQSGKGSLFLTLGGEPLFRGKLREGGIKLVEFPFDEVNTAMDDTFDEEEHEEDNTLYGDEPEEELEFLEEPEEGEEENSLEEEAEEEALEFETLPEAEGGAPITPETLPVQLTVEVGRVRMTADQLMELSPGKLLSLNVNPQQGVDLVLNGKRVGRGEIVQMGDTLGVRILKL